VRYYYRQQAPVARRSGQAAPDGSVLFAEVYAAKLGATASRHRPPDGNFAREARRLHAMARERGLGKDIPEMLRNENWNYAVFTADKQHRSGVNQAMPRLPQAARQRQLHLH